VNRVLYTLALVCLLSGPVFAQGVTLPDAHRVQLENGVVFILNEKHDVPLIGLQAVIPGGAANDPAGKAGLSSILAGLLEKGAADRDAAAFAESIDAVGGSLSASATLETISITGEFLARDAGLMIELLVDMLQAPHLDRAEMRKLRDRRINLLRAAKDNDPRQLTEIYGNAFLFGDHPYGTPVDGDEDSLARITADDIRAYYDDYVGANRLIISVAGDFIAADMNNLLSEAFRDWRMVEGPLAVVPAAETTSGRRVLLVDKPGATQSYFWIGNVGVARSYEQRAELNIANTLFGGRFTSLLVDEMRTNAGLTYGVYSTLRRPAAPGSVATVSFTKTETTVEAIDLAVSLLDKIRTEGFGDEIIASGKNYILGQFPPRLETAAQLAAQFAALETYGLDNSYIDDYGSAVAGAAGEAINTVIREVYPSPADLVFVIIGDAELLREDVAKYGPITEMPMTAPRFRP
jgi:predicted Zn-dependent peptidase